MLSNGTSRTFISLLLWSFYCIYTKLTSSPLQALFCSSLPHPSADKDYALYEIGTGSEVPELMPGIDLLSESFRSDGRSVVSALRWVTEELARSRHFLIVSDLYNESSHMVNGILVPVRTSFGLRRHGGKTYNVST